MSKNDCRKLCMETWGWKQDIFYDTWNTMSTGKPNTKKINREYLIRKTQEKKYWNNNRQCYFCPENKDLLEHHVSYIPEILIYLCKKCHHKHHLIIQEYHKLNIVKDKVIANLTDKLTKIMSLLEVAK